MKIGGIDSVTRCAPAIVLSNSSLLRLNEVGRYTGFYVQRTAKHLCTVGISVCEDYRGYALARL